MSKIQIVVGETKFRHSYADGQPLWTVKKARGGDSYDCVVEDDEWEGAKKVFGAEEIRSAITQALAWDNLANSSGDWFSKLNIGDTYHYHNGFGSFVRCVVVYGEDDLDGKTKKLLQPIALVGDWKSYDLPRRQPDGSIHYPYHAKHVIEQSDAWRPSAGCIYEHPDYARSYSLIQIDPRGLEPISLTLPSMTVVEQELAILVNLRDNAVRVLSDHNLSTAEDYKRVFDDVISMLGLADAEDYKRAVKNAMMMGDGDVTTRN